MSAVDSPSARAGTWARSGAGLRRLAGVRGVWWLSPPGAVLLVVPLTLLLAVTFPDATYRSEWKEPKSITGGTALLFTAAALLFILGALLPLATRTGERTGARRFGAAELRTLRVASDVLFRVTVFGYVAYAAVGAARGARPAQFLSAVSSQDNFASPLKDEFTPVPGVTTLTQVGIAYVVLGAVLLCRDPRRGDARRVLVVLLLALMRTFFLTERLALIELVLPAVAASVLVGLDLERPGRRLLARLAPVLLLPAVVALFSVFEYSRSWVFYSQRSSGSFATFALARLAGYYSTSYNNGQLQLEHLGAGHGLPYATLEALWTAPGIAQLHLYRRLGGQDQTAAFDLVLKRFGNPEFNSPGGLAQPFVDYGHVGGLVFMLLAGLALGHAYRRCVEGASWAVLVYPLGVTGLFELPRYLYWSQGRLVPAVVALLLVAWRLERARRPRGASEAAPSS